MFKTFKFIIASLLFVGAGAVSAQEKITVGIVPFSSSSPADAAVASAVQEQVKSVLVTSNRFTVLDRQNIDELKKEMELQKTEDFIDNNVSAQQGIKQGAMSMFFGKVISSSTRAVTSKDSKTGVESIAGYKAEISVSIELINVATGSVISSAIIGTKKGNFLTEMGDSFTTAPSKDEATRKEVLNLKNDVQKFISKEFPVVLSIVELQGKQILISGGSAAGLSKGSLFKVCEIVSVTVGGKETKRRKEIGQLKLAKVEDDNFSLCDFKSGKDKDAILERHNAGAILEVVEITK